MPIARMTRSTVMVSVLPSLAFRVAVTLSAPFFSSVTCVPSFSFMPCLVKALAAIAEISSSSTGMTRSMISTTVTSAPKVL